MACNKNATPDATGNTIAILSVDKNDKLSPALRRASSQLVAGENRPRTRLLNPFAVVDPSALFLSVIDDDDEDFRSMRDLVSLREVIQRVVSFLIDEREGINRQAVSLSRDHRNDLCKTRRTSWFLVKLDSRSLLAFAIDFRNATWSSTPNARAGKHDE